MDTDLDGELSSEEIDAAPDRLKKLDRDGDGRLDRDELRAPPGCKGPPSDQMDQRGNPGMRGRRAGGEFGSPGSGPGRFQGPPSRRREGGPGEFGGDERPGRGSRPPQDELPPA
ncbi:MAG: hypothetical protein HQ582_05830 [Planctomycetes bacterium]|nr:hypothetical protein [Planctomycetota bacterium]